jgi:hypothetical protein
VLQKKSDGVIGSPYMGSSPTTKQIKGNISRDRNNFFIYTQQVTVGDIDDVPDEQSSQSARSEKTEHQEFETDTRVVDIPPQIKKITKKTELSRNSKRLTQIKTPKIMPSNLSLAEARSNFKREKKIQQQPKQGSSRNMPLPSERQRLATEGSTPQNERNQLLQNSIRTESLEKILGDKAEVFFQSVERTLKKEESFRRKKPPTVVMKTIHLDDPRPATLKSLMQRKVKSTLNDWSVEIFTPRQN